MLGLKQPHLIANENHSTPLRGPIWPHRTGGVQFSQMVPIEQL